MGCDDGGGYSEREKASQHRWYEARRIIERFSEEFLSSFKVKESLLIHKFKFGKDISEEDLAILKAAEKRIFGKKGRKGNPYDAGKRYAPAYRPGQNHI